LKREQNLRSVFRKHDYFFGRVGLIILPKIMLIPPTLCLVFMNATGVGLSRQGRHLSSPIGLLFSGAWLFCVFRAVWYAQRGKERRNPQGRVPKCIEPPLKSVDVGSTLRVIWWADVPRIENRSQTLGENSMGKQVHLCIGRMHFFCLGLWVLNTGLLTPNHLPHSTATGAIKTV